MVIAPTSITCDTNYKFNSLYMMQSPTLYQIPMLTALSSVIQQVNYDIHDEVARRVEIGGNFEGTASPFEGGIFGRLAQVCSTEMSVVRTSVKKENLSLRCLLAIYEVSDLTVNPDYGMSEEIANVAPEIRNTSARQIERFGYLGYQGVPLLENIPGLRGLVDISTAFVSPPTLPIDPTDYESLCQFFTNGINQARKGNVQEGYEFTRTDISVHVSSDVRDKINCALVSSTTIGVWERILSGVLDGITVVISDQISNKVFFVNNRRIEGKYNYILEQTNPVSDILKTKYGMKLGTISFNPGSTTPPVVFATDVLS